MQFWFGCRFPLQDSLAISRVVGGGAEIQLILHTMSPQNGIKHKTAITVYATNAQVIDIVFYSVLGWPH